MNNVLINVLSICSQTFQRTYQILNEQKTDGSFEVKVMIYRNYNAPI